MFISLSDAQSTGSHSVIMGGTETLMNRMGAFRNLSCSLSTLNYSELFFKAVMSEFTLSSKGSEVAVLLPCVCYIPANILVCKKRMTSQLCERMLHSHMCIT